MKNITHTKLPVSILTFFLIVFVFILGAPKVFAAGGAVLTQFYFGFRNDNGSEITATWMAATNTNVTNIAKNTNFRIRISTNAGGGSVIITPQLEYLLASGHSCTSTGWTKISTSTSNAFALASSANFTDKASTTQQLSYLIFVAGEILQATNPADSISLPSTYFTEHEYSIKATTNASDNTAYIFRLSNNGAAFGGYSVCPQATTSAAVSAPTVTTSSPSPISDTSATLNGNITATGGANPTVRGFAYGTASDLSTVIATTTESGSFGTGAFTDFIFGLSCGTTYYSRAYATNIGGTGFGTTTSFNTSSCSPHSPKIRFLNGFIRFLNGSIKIR
jgi:hypothetical protein